MTNEEFWHILHTAPLPASVFFRLYYDANGCPLFYSMDDLPGTYIDIDADTYAKSSMTVRIKDGKIIDIVAQTSDKLIPGNTGISCDYRDIAVISNSTKSIKWKKKTYEES